MDKMHAMCKTMLAASPTHRERSKAFVSAMNWGGAVKSAVQLCKKKENHVYVLRWVTDPGIKKIRCIENRWHVTSNWIKSLGRWRSTSLMSKGFTTDPQRHNFSKCDRSKTSHATSHLYCDKCFVLPFFQHEESSSSKTIASLSWVICCTVW